MIKFFRIIRQNLLSAGSAGKYLKYAAGEIVLVVAGILIALSINNWNENRKEEILEREILTEIRDNLIADVALFSNNLNIQHDRAEKISKLIDHIEAKYQYHDSLDYYFFLPVLMEGSQGVQSGYETLKSIGVEKLHSKKIRKELVNYYDVLCPNLSKVVDLRNLVNTLSMSDYFKASFRRQKLTESQMRLVSGVISTGLKPMNYEKLISDVSFLNYLYERKDFKLGVYHSMQSEIIQEATTLIDLINDELKY